MMFTKFILALTLISIASASSARPKSEICFDSVYFGVMTGKIAVMDFKAKLIPDAMTASLYFLACSELAVSSCKDVSDEVFEEFVEYLPEESRTCMIKTKRVFSTLGEIETYLKNGDFLAFLKGAKQIKPEIKEMQVTCKEFNPSSNAMKNY